MLTAFDTTSHRVKGLSFHPTRPWILASLHSGAIQLWDYRIGALLETYDEHEGPVRGVDFHKSQPLFVSGGDDYKIKVWDYTAHRCLFTLLGHLDYVRTVEFHHEYPWIVSACDDQTIRIWNWQSRNCIAVLTGHNHYVMSASFSMKDDLVVSASLDHTVRVWDLSGSDLFGSSDAAVKYVLEGHDRGVNWASFHKSLPLIASAADDRSIKLWRMSDTRAWEMDTLRAHGHNVSCVLFHPIHELLISNSEDRTIRIWDISKRMLLESYRRESDRFWILATHPSQNKLAAGHDTGMVVFKLERERPAFAAKDGQLFYVKDRYLRRSVLGAGADVPIVPLRWITSNFNFKSLPREVQLNRFSPAEDQILVQSNHEGGSYQLYLLNSDGEPAPVSGRGVSVAFCGRSRFAVLAKESSGAIVTIRNLQNQIIRRMTLPTYNPDALFQANVPGRLIVRDDDRLVLVDTGSHVGITELRGLRFKSVVWSADGKFAALMSRQSLVICNRELRQICVISEAARLKSAAWTADHVLVYTTLTHMKYALPTVNGDRGILRSLEIPLYIVEVREDSVFCLNRDGAVRTVKINTVEFEFKQALRNQEFGKVLTLIRRPDLNGKAVISYLQQAGFPEVALHFVKDDATKFKLAMECGNLKVAQEAARALNTEETWNKLAQAALNQGVYDIVETAYQQTQNMQGLTFLYHITGDIEKVRKMLMIANVQKDVMAQFHNSLFLGDAEARLKVLEQAGQTPLAYATAATFGLTEDAERLKTCLEEAGLPVPSLTEGATALLPPTPILKHESWPQLTVSKGYFDATTIEAAMSAAPASSATAAAAAAAAAADTDIGADAWGDDMDLGLDGPADGGAGGGGAVDTAAAGGGWGDDLDLDLGDVELPTPTAAGTSAGGTGDVFVAPTPGKSAIERWVSNSSVAADHVAAGSFESAMQLLHRQIGIVNFAPLRKHFFAIYTSTQCSVPGLVGAINTPLSRNGLDGKDSLPVSTVGLEMLVNKLTSVYSAFQAGRFADVDSILDDIIGLVPLACMSNAAEAKELKQLLIECREYKTAVRLEMTRKEEAASGGAPARQLELAAYMTHCNLRPAHSMLALNLAMSLAFKLKNFISAAGFARRLLELPELSTAKNVALATKSKKVLTLSEQQARNAVAIDFDERNPFVICCGSFTPIYRGSPEIRSPYIGASYKPEFAGQVCRIDGMSKIGEETLGLVCINSNKAAGGGR